MNNLDKFTSFLENVDLAGYRKRFIPIKIVEMDLPKDIQAIALLYEIYWDKKQFISFDEFYNIYLHRKKILLENFRKKIMMCETCFYLGLPARIYRTWASIITQIHAGYVAESVFGDETVKMSEELDHKGADFQVNYNGYIINYQVKKMTFSREVRREKKSNTKLEGEFFDLPYEVINESYFKNPKKRNGEFKIPYLRFIRNKWLKRLNNGFTVFTIEPFEMKKGMIDKL